MLLLFLVGIEIDFAQIDSRRSRLLVTSAIGIAVSLVLGFGLGEAIHPLVASHEPSVTFSLFVTLTLAITALPIVGRIIIELGLHQTPLGALTMASAVIDDAVGWSFLPL